MVQEATWLPDGRLAGKTVTNSGSQHLPNDGGNVTLHYYYALGHAVEDRNGSNQTLRQYLWGASRGDELVWLEVNGDPTIGNDTSPDNSASGEGGESPSDARYVFCRTPGRSSLVGLPLRCRPGGWRWSGYTSYVLFHG